MATPRTQTWTVGGGGVGGGAVRGHSNKQYLDQTQSKQGIKHVKNLYIIYNTKNKWLLANNNIVG